jgi:hypothetical protein
MFFYDWPPYNIISFKNFFFPDSRGGGRRQRRWAGPPSLAGQPPLGDLTAPPPRRPTAGGAPALRQAGAEASLCMLCARTSIASSWLALKSPLGNPHYPLYLPRQWYLSWLETRMGATLDRKQEDKGYCKLWVVIIIMYDIQYIISRPSKWGHFQQLSIFHPILYSPHSRAYQLCHIANESRWMSCCYRNSSSILHLSIILCVPYEPYIVHEEPYYMLQVVARCPHATYRTRQSSSSRNPGTTCRRATYFTVVDVAMTMW